MAAGSGVRGEREYKPLQRGAMVTLYIRQRGMATAREIAEWIGCSLRTAYRTLDELSEILGLYKEGVYYVVLEVTS